MLLLAWRLVVLPCNKQEKPTQAAVKQNRNGKETHLRTAVLQGNVVSKQNRNGKETRLRTAVLTRRCSFDTISITL